MYFNSINRNIFKGEKEMTFPKKVKMSGFEINLVLVEHDISYEVAEQQGSFVSKPPLTIYLDKKIIDKADRTSLNVLIHEFLHFSYYQYQLSATKQLDDDTREELEVNSMANSIIELLLDTDLKPWILKVMKECK